MGETLGYDNVHKRLQIEGAVQRERELLEGIAPAIAFLERKLADTSEALESLKRVRATALREITKLEGGDMEVSYAGSRIGTDRLNNGDDNERQG